MFDIIFNPTSGKTKSAKALNRVKDIFATVKSDNFKAVFDAANFIRTVVTRQGLQIACLQEIAYENGWMTADEIRESCSDMLKTEYGQYLMRMIEK